MPRSNEDVGTIQRIRQTIKYPLHPAHLAQHAPVVQEDGLADFINPVLGVNQGEPEGGRAKR